MQHGNGNMATQVEQKNRLISISVPRKITNFADENQKQRQI
jgi:hypothetical protein